MSIACFSSYWKAKGASMKGFVLFSYLWWKKTSLLPARPGQPAGQSHAPINTHTHPPTFTVKHNLEKRFDFPKNGDVFRLATLCHPHSVRCTTRCRLDRFPSWLGKHQFRAIQRVEFVHTAHTRHLYTRTQTHQPVRQSLLCL